MTITKVKNQAERSTNYDTFRGLNQSLSFFHISHFKLPDLSQAYERKMELEWEDYTLGGYMSCVFVITVSLKFMWNLREFGIFIKKYYLLFLESFTVK